MKPTEEQLELIKSCIVQHPRYDQKKCRLGEFVILVFEKSALFINSISNESTIKKFIKKIVDENIDECNFETEISKIAEKQPRFEQNQIETFVQSSDEIQFEEPVFEAPDFELYENLNNLDHQTQELNFDLNQNFQKDYTQEQELIIAQENESNSLHQEVQTLQFDNIGLEILNDDGDPIVINEEASQEVSIEISSQQSEMFEKEIQLIEQEPFEKPEEARTLIMQSELQAQFKQQEPEPEIYVPQTLPTEPQELAYKDLKDPIEDTKVKKVSKELTERIIDIVGKAHKQEPENQYAKIFYMKYAKKMKQSEIAKRLNISEEDLCNRYLKLVRIVKKELE